MKKHISFSRINTRVLIAIPVVLGFFCIGIQLFVFKAYTGKFIEDLLISFTFFFWGLSGVPMIVRKEAPGFLPSGIFAVIEGVILVILGWGIAFGPWIYQLFFSGR